MIKLSAVFLLGSIAGAAVMALRPRPAPDIPAPLHRPGNAELALERAIPEVRFDGVSFAEAVRRLGEAGGVEIVADWESITRAFVDPGAEVRYRGRQVALADALIAVSDSAGGAVGGEIEYFPEGGRVVLRASPPTGPQTVLRLYDARDLLLAAQELADRFGPPGYGAESGFYGPAAPPSPAEELVHLIQECVAPDSWRVNGGSYGSIHLFSGRLAVVQSFRNHWQIRQLLDQFRAVPASSVP